MWGLLLALLLLVIMLWLFSGGSQSIGMTDTLVQVKKDLSRILKSLQIREPNYQLEEGTTSYFTESRFGGKKIVLYTNSDYNSILFAACHEMTHLLSDEVGHGDKFLKLERKLHDKAKALGLLSSKQISGEYPCQ